MSRHLLTCFLLLWLSTALYGQDPAIRQEEEKLYEKGLALLHKEQWGAARHTFEEYLEKTGREDLQQAEAKYYVALCALHLYNDDAESLTENFIRYHENHPKAILAYYELGRFYYNDKKYSKAANYFEKVNVSQLTQPQREEVNFNLAYTYFSNREFDKALERFNQLKRTDNRYTYAASYYAGYIYFNRGEYDQAIYDLQRAAKNEAYEQVVPSLIATIYYRQGQYDKLIAYAEEAGKGRRGQKDELEQLVAEAYYQKGQYEKAATRFEDYAQGKKLEEGLRYRMAYAQYKSEQEEEALKNFKLVADNPDSLGQYAAYYLGTLYVQEGNKPFAQTAFKKAASMNFNKEIAEESKFALAKINYELGNYQEAAEQLKSFTQEYARSPYLKEAKELLSKSLLNSNDYGQALAYMEQLDNKSPEIRETYQEVSYLKGTELFNDAKFYQAVQMFEKSLRYPQNEELVAKANYWSGEAYSIGKKWNEAINSYAAVFRNTRPNNPLHLASRYGIGYAYYNTEQYDRALTHFKEYVDRGGEKAQFYNDALLRLADSYYANKIYGNAIDTYRKAIREGNPEQDYAYFQLGLVNSINDREQEALNAWNTVLEKFGRSPYYDDALYNKAQLQLEMGNYQEAISGFKKLQQSQPNSPFIPYALRSIAVAYFNQKEYERAAQNYQQLLKEYPSHQTANSALIGLQETLALLGRTDEFDKYLVLYKNANPSDKSLENVEFETIKAVYFSQRYEKAIENLQAYLRNYPNGSNAGEARFYLAESLYRLNRDQEALSYYVALADNEKGPLRQRALNRVAEIAYKNENYQQAVDYYRKLASGSTNKRQQTDAFVGLMESFYLQNKYDSASYYANRLLEMGGSGANVENKALLYKGKINFAKGNYEEAMEAFLQTTNAAKDENGAEAQYMIALIQHNQKKYQQSVETLFAFNSNYSMYRYWLGKSFILIAENYRQMGELFQAKETLKSIIANSKDARIVEEAKAKLAAIEKQEAAQTPVITDTTARK
ncbi:tetratricopeptide repeat protein [Nafulsella turpanensis]|uniref:tetratricopeptide repeat protein n=1 Tax=Nafulsella turpanensis TaxID=1265690 RepID=UPI00058D32C2|nr:tetratricopeptide repeat protein [Nafulsella turpanensis]